MKLKIIKIIRVMSAIFVLLGLFILILILYLLLPNVECFENGNYSKEETEIIINREIGVIRISYDKIKDYYSKGYLINNPDVEKEKAVIRGSFAKIYDAVPSSTDKMTINQIYYGSSSNYGLRKILNEPQPIDANFMASIDKIRRLQPKTNEIDIQISNIISNYKEIKSLISNKQPIIDKKVAIKTSIDDIRSRLSNITDKEKMDIIITSMKTIIDNNDSSNFTLKANEIAGLLFIQSSADVLQLRNYYQFFKTYSDSSDKNKKKGEILALLEEIKGRIIPDVDKKAMTTIINDITIILNNTTIDNSSDDNYNSKLSLIETLLLQSAPDINLLRSYFSELQGNDEKKTQINNLLINIRGRLLDFTDKQKLDIIYYGTANPDNDNFGIIVYLDEINDAKFNNLINKTKGLIPAIMKTSSYKSGYIDEIKVIFSELNNLYRDIYINKFYTYENKKEEINTKINLIYTKLLVITTLERINEIGIGLILNTTLKRAYERNDTIEINTNKLSFEEKLNNLKISSSIGSSASNRPLISKGDALTTVVGVSESSYGMPIEDTLKSSPISKKVRDLTLDNITDDFNNIYNSFELINIIYKNKTKDNKVDDYIKIILNSIDNIGNYYSTNLEYKNKIVSIRNVIIKPIIINDLYNAYYNDNYTSIAKNKNKFLSAINEIKNLVINNYGKRKGMSLNTNVCFDNIIKAVNNYNYPIRVSNISGCDISMFNDRDILVSQKMFVSDNDGIMWKPATKLADYKKTGINNYPYLYNYGIAVSNDNGNNWKMA